MIRFLLLMLTFSMSLNALSLKEPSGELKEPFIELLTLFEIPQDLPERKLLPLLLEHWIQKSPLSISFQRRLNEKEQEAFPLLQELGCIDTISPKEPFYRYALIMGGNRGEVQKRLDFLYDEWKKGLRFVQVILLTDERVLPLIEKHPLKEIAPHIFVSSNPQKRKSIAARRITDWLDTNPTPGNCLVISSQPHIGYEEAVARLFLPETFSVEGVGAPAPFDPFDRSISQTPYPLLVYLDNIARWYIYESMTETQ
ncbi:MAG: hypothetical protein KR126chlam1_01427 [Chlamydiae bacterium]|nr:hypothetical protein [Chlamydiota bacterium]